MSPFSIIMPQLVLMSTGCLLLLAGLFPNMRRWCGPISLFISAMTLWLLVDFTPREDTTNSTFSERWVTPSNLGFAIQWCALVFGVFLQFIMQAEQKSGELPTGLFGMLLVSISGVMLVGLANDLLVMFVGLELATVPLMFVLHLSSRSSEMRASAMNVLKMGLISSLLLLFGFGLIYGLAGSSNLVEIQSVLTESYVSVDPSEVRSGGSRWGIAAMGLVFSALAIRMGAVPFHFGGMSEFKGEWPWSIGLLMLVPKTVAVIVIVRVGLFTMVGFEGTGMLISMVLSVGTMLFGGMRSLAEPKIRGVLVSIAVAQFGFVLMGLTVAFWSFPQIRAGANLGEMPNGLTAAMFHLLMTGIAFVAVVGVLAFLSRRLKQSLIYTDDFRGIIRSEPWAASCLLVAIFSLASIPPMPGFWGRLLLFLSAMSVQSETSPSPIPTPDLAFVLLAISAIVSLLCIAAALFRWVVAIVFGGQSGGAKSRGGFSAILTSGLACVLLLAVGLFPGKTIALVERLTQDKQKRANSSQGDRRIDNTSQAGSNGAALKRDRK
jgi:NADH-quinone oxidoreductase subunit N